MGTNIHWPTDSSLLWDTYRVLPRHIEHAREIDPEAVGNGRLHRRRARRDAQTIVRKARKHGPASTALRGLYRRLIERVEGIGEWARSVAEGLVRGIEAQRYGVWEHAQAEALVEALTGVAELGNRLVDQARRRVLQGESVPNEEKLFSLFEPHTELLRVLVRELGVELIEPPWGAHPAVLLQPFGGRSRTPPCQVRSRAELRG